MDNDTGQWYLMGTDGSKWRMMLADFSFAPTRLQDEKYKLEMMTMNRKSWKITRNTQKYDDRLNFYVG